ncbi:MAG: 5'-methylthioadenosine/S-adenosylhomocysteine nucleosidase [Bacilli bacterium]|nr:5'-methylthioadenosine/S-adenosylhomocysteine nucleosidase [Bacilli bacterium]
MEKEAKPLLEESRILSSRKCGLSLLYEVEKDGVRFLVGVSGVAKAFAASMIAEICLLYPDVEQIINVGVGGSLDAKKAPLLSAVIASSFVEHDYDTSAFGDPIGYVWGIGLINIPASKTINGSLELACRSLNIPCCPGVMASGDQFIVEEAKKKELAKDFNCLSVDMESAPMAQIAYSYGKEFSALRIVSDTGNKGEYEAFVHKAAELAKKVILALLAQ